VTATPVHNCLADLVQLFQLFLRDDALTALGVPSLSHAARGGGDLDLLRGAVARLTVARSRERIQSGYPDGLGFVFPKRRPGRAIRVGPLPDLELDAAVTTISRLAPDAAAGPLLRLLFLHRLSSSVAAFADSVSRYAAYAELAVAAGESGRSLSRRDFRGLFPERGTDALQLVLFPMLLPPGAAVTPPADAGVLTRLRDFLRGFGDPKAERLAALLDADPMKTIVFTGARATARYLARRLSRRRVAAVFGDHGWLAGAPVTRREVLRAFAPVGQGAPPPGPALETDCLIATDLLSEGLNLQDADAVMHYDLPWTPLRLEQRLGRIARLGSRHNQVRVWWFRPCDTLERFLSLASRLGAKADGQLRLGVPTSSSVGRARIQGGLYDWRERFGSGAERGSAAPRFAVVRAPAAALLALRWTVGDQTYPELMVLAGDPPDVVDHEAGVQDWVARLVIAPASPAPPPPAYADALHLTARTRLANALHGPRDDDTRRLARGVLRLGALAAHSRQTVTLGLLDQTLDRLVGGVALGAMRGLHDLLRQRLRPAALRRWLHDTPARSAECPGVTLEAALLGDGTLTGTG
jgi:hypothetical protein